MLKTHFKKALDTILLVGGVLGLVNILEDAGSWLGIFKVNTALSLFVVVTATAWLSVRITDKWRSKAIHSMARRVAGYFVDRTWAVRDLFREDMAEGHLRAYQLAADSTEPPQAGCTATRGGVIFKRPWQATLPEKEGQDFWVASTFITKIKGRKYSFLEPVVRRAYDPIYSANGLDEWHRQRLDDDRYMRYRLVDGGALSNRIRLGKAARNEWTELGTFALYEDGYVTQSLFDAVDFGVISEFQISFFEHGIPRGLRSNPPSFIFSRVASLRLIQDGVEEPELDQLLYCRMNEDHSSGVLGMPVHKTMEAPSLIHFGLAFQRSAIHARNTVVDRMITYTPSSRTWSGSINIDWR